MDMKRTFYGICNWLRDDPEHLARVLVGSACEAWLNTEAVVAMNWSESKLLDLDREYAYAEVAKRDICVFPHDRETPRELLDEEQTPAASHVIEAKVVYPWATSKIKEKLETLVPQVRRRADSRYEDASTRHSGLIYAVWSSYYEVPQSDFYGTVSEVACTLFPDESYTTQHDYRVEAIIGEQVVQLHREYRLALGALYVTRRRE